MDEEWFVVSCVTMLIAGTLWGIMMGLTYSDIYNNNEVIAKQLGNAICVENSDNTTEFDNFSDGVLYCKPIQKLQSYDGIKIAIGGNTQ